jgi:hypothetical protein
MESTDAAAAKAAATPSRGVSPSKESPSEDGSSGDDRSENHEFSRSCMSQAQLMSFLGYSHAMEVQKK